MTKAGYILIWVGFIAAAYVAVQDRRAVDWGMFVIPALVAVVGVAAIQWGKKQSAEHGDTVASNIQDIEQSVTRLSENVAKLNREKEMINTYDVRHKIDEMLVADLDRFANARETLATQYGLDAYADVMSHFAAGERYLNRVWSCSADGYVDEVNEYLQRAEDQFATVFEKFSALRGAAP